MSDAPAVPDSPDLVVCGDGLARPRWAASDPLLREYYDTEWGMPVRDERGVFERLSLEAFQSGLSWATILRKRPAFREAFANFDPDAVAAFDDDDMTRLLADASIVRNRAKILAALTNARAPSRSARTPRSAGWPAWCGPTGPLARPSPAAPPTSPARSAESTALAKDLKLRGFRFVGPTTCFALMEAIGIVDTHLLGSYRRGSSGVWS